MGFDDGQILLESGNGAYYAGQTVYGRVVFNQGKPKTIHGEYLYVYATISITLPKKILI